MCLYGCIGRNLGTASVWTNQADRRKNMPKCDQERGRQCWKQGRTRGRKNRESLDGGESGERRGPWPDHTDTLGSLSPCQLCIAVDSERTHSHTHILIYACWRWEHTWPVCVFECVFECDNLSMRAKESVDATKKSYCLCLFSLQPLCLCVHAPEPVCTSVCV